MTPLIIILILAGAGFCVWFFSEDTTLRRRAVGRMHDAERRRILEKAEFILDVFGVYRSCEYADGVLRITRSEREWRSSSDGSKQESKDVAICLVGTSQSVYKWDRHIDRSDGSSTGGVTAYVPGQWEQHFQELHEKATETKRVKDKDWKLAEKQRLKRDFGL